MNVHEPLNSDATRTKPACRKTKNIEHCNRGCDEVSTFDGLISGKELYVLTTVTIVRTPQCVPPSHGHGHCTHDKTTKIDIFPHSSLWRCLMTSCIRGGMHTKKNSYFSVCTRGKFHSSGLHKMGVTFSRTPTRMQRSGQQNRSYRAECQGQLHENYQKVTVKTHTEHDRIGDKPTKL